MGLDLSEHSSSHAFISKLNGFAFWSLKLFEIFLPETLLPHLSCYPMQSSSNPTRNTTIAFRQPHSRIRSLNRSKILLYSFLSYSSSAAFHLAEHCQSQFIILLLVFQYITPLGRCSSFTIAYHHPSRTVVTYHSSAVRSLKGFGCSYRSAFCYTST